MTSAERLRRHDWTVEPVSQTEARELIERVHYAGGCPRTSVARHGLRRLDELAISGVALWLPPTRPAAVSVDPGNPGGVLSLSRLCVDEAVPRNGASYLLAASMRALDRSRWPVLLTYADTALGHTGAIYAATGWERVGLVEGADTWRHRETGERRGRKRGPNNYTCAQMVELGFERLPRRPKVKWTHRARGAAC